MTTVTPPSVTTAIPTSSETTIRDLNSSVTIFSAPFSRSGAEIGVRMSAIKLSNGDLILYNPTLLDEPTKTKLQSLGTVKYIITPNLVHHTFAAPYATAFPQAKFIGPDGIAAKKKDEGVHFTVEMKDANIDYNTIIGWGSEVDYIYVPDFAQKEILLFHHPTKTLFIADMLYSLPATEQYQSVIDKSRAPSNASPWGLQHALDSSLQPEGFLGRALNLAADKKTDQFKAGMHKMIEQWTPATIVPEHGDVITSGADAKLRSAYKWVRWEQ
jgi:hypothetical protein